MKRRQKFYSNQANKKARTEQNDKHAEDADNAAVEEADYVLTKLHTISTLIKANTFTYVPERILTPANISTMRSYQGMNVHILHLAMQSRFKTDPTAISMGLNQLPLFATFDQLGQMDLHIRKGEKAAAYIKIYHYKEGETYQDDTWFLSWKPVFHLSQVTTESFENNDTLITKIQAYEASQKKWWVPTWIQKLEELYTQRTDLESSEVEPLVIQCMRVILCQPEYAHTFSNENLKERLPADIIPYVWPACGIPYLDEKLEHLIAKGQPELPKSVTIESLQARCARSEYRNAYAYYSHLIYLVVQASLYQKTVDDEDVTDPEERVHVLVNAALVCKSLGFLFCFSKTPAIQKALKRLFKSEDDNVLYRKNYIGTILNHKKHFTCSYN